MTNRRSRRGARTDRRARGTRGTGERAGRGERRVEADDRSVQRADRIEVDDRPARRADRVEGRRDVYPRGDRGGRGAVAPARPRRADRRDRRRAGTPWWVWLLGLLALGLIAFMVWQGLDDGASGSTQDGSAATAEEGAGVGEPSVAAGDVDLLSLAGDPDALAGYEGQEVRASSAVVESVVSDEGFWVGETAAERLFVFLDIPAESGPDIDPGDEVDFTGTLEPLPLDFAERFDVTPGEGSADLEAQGRYLHVTQIVSG